jgi:hypothetical protein
MDVVPGRHLQAIDEASTGIAAARALARDCELRPLARHARQPNDRLFT